MGADDAVLERLFERQVARARGADGQVDIAALGRLVCASYAEAERDRLRTDRAMALMGEELEGANRELSRILQESRLHALRFETALQNMPHGLIMYDVNEQVVVVNDRLVELLTLPPGSIRPGMTMRDVMDLRATHGQFGGTSIEEAIASRRDRLQRRGGAEIEETIGERTIFASASPAPGGGFVFVVQDITERRAAEARIAHLARHDGLTGLPNRTQLIERLEEAQPRLARGARFALLCLDLDRFKQVNDTLGHPIGDKLLQQVTRRLKGAVRETDVVARLGGDEFAIIQDSANQPEDVTALASRLVREVSEPYVIDDHRIVIGTSIGIALAPNDGVSAETLLKCADLALYRSKSEGRGAWRFFEPEMDERMQRRRRVETDLRAALENREFELEYQPLIDAETSRLSGFEALVRWRHPQRGRISPAEFVPLAEETGLILPLGKMVLDEACAEAARWPGELSVAVNVSAVQFRQPDFVAHVAEALATSGLTASRLELEVTETIMLHDNAATVAQLYRLRRLGVRISMDDFGTGYSSLSYLRSFPFDKIKIDQSFIQEIPTRTPRPRPPSARCRLPPSSRASPTRAVQARHAVLRHAAGHDAAEMARSGSTFSATPCQLTQRVTRTPMAPILSSVPPCAVRHPDADAPLRRSPGC
jgi:diguanylate cyclase (GGDEF)-like protein/PAS domain S-box-containing protein